MGLKRDSEQHYWSTNITPQGSHGRLYGHTKTALALKSTVAILSCIRYKYMHIVNVTIIDNKSYGSLNLLKISYKGTL